MLTLLLQLFSNHQLCLKASTCELAKVAHTVCILVYYSIIIIIIIMIKSHPHSSLTAGSCCYLWDTGGDNVQAGCARKAFWDEVKHCAQLRDGHCREGRQERENKYTNSDYSCSWVPLRPLRSAAASQSSLSAKEAGSRCLWLLPTYSPAPHTRCAAAAAQLQGFFITNVT